MQPPSPAHRPARFFRLVPASLFAGALAIGAMIATAPGAQADLGTVEAQCLLGGSWIVNEGVGAVCCHEQHCDSYWPNGDFMGSDEAWNRAGGATR